jgi:hypothetical protein
MTVSITNRTSKNLTPKTPAKITITLTSITTADLSLTPEVTSSGHPNLLLLHAQTGSRLRAAQCPELICTLLQYNQIIWNFIIHHMVTTNHRPQVTIMKGRH